MHKSTQLSIPPSSATPSISGSAKRRSTRLPRRSEDAASSSDIGNAMRDKDVVENVDQTSTFGSSPAGGWKHPAELQYIRRADWSKDLMITYLCQKAFTVPPRQVKTSASYTEITRCHSGENILIPRGYRTPLMFVAKFQWESLRLVLHSDSEWEEYKFDIIHLSRLCTHFFKQAKSASSENKMTKSWRSPMFDRALIRFYRKWMVCREWSVKKFWEEFDEEEYTLDVLKFDWSRWVLKGHKGFVLTKEEVQNGITADQYTNGLKRKSDGTWVWGGDDSGAKDTISLDTLNSLASQDAVEAITNAMPSHDSLDVKEELLEMDGDEGVVFNQNGKRLRADSHESPRKVITRLPKKSLPLTKKVVKKRKKSSLNLTPESTEYILSGDERLEKLVGIQHEGDTTMNNYRSRRPSVSEQTFHLAPVLTPSDPILKTIPIPWPTQPLHVTTSSQSEADSSSLGNSDVSNDGQAISATTSSDPSGQSMQTASADPETVPNAAAAINYLTVDAPLLHQSSIPPSPLTSGSSVSPKSPVVTGPPPPSSLPDANLPTPPMSGSAALTITPNPDLSSGSSCPLAPNVPAPRRDCTDISGDGDQDLDSCSLPELKINHMQNILETIQIMKTWKPKSTTETGSGITEVVAKEILTPLSPIPSSHDQQLVYPENFASETDKVEIIVLGIVGEDGAEADGTKSEVMDGEDPVTIVPLHSESKEEVDRSGKDVVEEPTVEDTTDDLVDDTNRADVGTESYAVESQPGPEMLITVSAIGGVEEVMELGVVEVQPVHIQSSQETPMNDTDGMGIALEMGTGDGQSVNSQPTPAALLNDSQSTHSAMESAPTPVESDSHIVEMTHPGDSEDKMNVDGETIQPIPSTPLPIDGNSSTNSLFLTSVVRTKSLHTIQLLRGMIHFLRMPTRQLTVSITPEHDCADVKSQGTCSATERPHYPLLGGPCLVTEEAISVDQRLDVLAQVSVTLAKNLYPYRGKTLETKIDLLDKSLQQQFETIQRLDSRGEMDEPLKELDARPEAEFDRNTASMSTQTISQGVQTPSSPYVDRQFQSIEIQTETEIEVLAPQQRPLSPDATMIDITLPTSPLQEPSSAKEKLQADNNRSVAKTVVSMMRNMADLLECTTQATSVRSIKGKEKEVVDGDMLPSRLDSPALTTLLEEFKGMKEEMRRDQQRSQSEVESMRLSHFMEVEALKDQIRLIEGRGKQELDEVTRRYSREIGELKATLTLREERERIRDREKEGGSEMKVPSLDLLEIRRRVASLEARTRSDSIPADMLRSASRSSMTNGHFSEPVITRPPHFNQPHLIPTDFEESPYPRAPRQFMREGSMSKPGTPAPSDRNFFSNRHTDVMDLDENMPLPAKSQRKMHMMNFPRPPMG